MFYGVVHQTNYRNQCNLHLEAYKRIFLVNTYSSTLTCHLGVCWIWSLVCLSKHLLIPLDMPNLFCLEAFQCFDLWCGYAAHSAQTVYGANHLVLAIYLWVYYPWMSPEWTTVCHLTAHYLKELQSSLELWGYHPSRGKPSLFPSRCGSRYVEVTSKPTSWKHQWHSGWAGQLTYYKLRV